MVHVLNTNQIGSPGGSGIIPPLVMKLASSLSTGKGELSLSIAKVTSCDSSRASKSFTSSVVG